MTLTHNKRKIPRDQHKKRACIVSRPQSIVTAIRRVPERAAAKSNAIERLFYVSGGRSMGGSRDEVGWRSIKRADGENDYISWPIDLFS
jgi:hypothetical protein